MRGALEHIYVHNIHKSLQVGKISLIHHRGPLEGQPKPMEGFGTGDQVSLWNRCLLCCTGGHEQHTALSPAYNLFILTFIKRAIVAFFDCARIAFSTVTVAIMEVVPAFISARFNQHCMYCLIVFFTAQINIICIINVTVADVSVMKVRPRLYSGRGDEQLPAAL